MRRASTEIEQRVPNAYARAKALGLLTEGALAQGSRFYLVNVEGGHPRHLTDELVNAAIAHGVNKVCGTGPFNVRGKGVAMALLEPGKPDAARDEPADQLLFVEDFALPLNGHATVVCGGITARGFKTKSYGLAPGAVVSTRGGGNHLIRLVDIVSAAPLNPLNSIPVSDHSYGF